MKASRSRPWLVGLFAGVIAGAMLTAGLVSAQSNGSTHTPATDGNFTMYDTPGSTFLLNKKTGEVWRIGFTEVRGERHWFGTHVPLQPPQAFDAFQKRLRQKLSGAGGR